VYSPVVFGLTLFLVVVLLPAGLVPSISRLAGYPIRRMVGRTVPVPAPSPAAQVGAQPRRQTSAETLSVSDVTKRFFGNEVLRGLSLQVRRGRLTALVGPNGSGKTTVINLVTGFLRADHGSIRLGDRDLSGLSPVRVAKAGVRRTFQVPQLSLPLSVSDNVATGLLSTHSTGLVTTIARLPRFRRVERERRTLVLRACAAAAIPIEMWDRPVAELSLASRRQVEVARAIVGAAAVILLDEPASGLNLEEVQHLASLLRATVGPALLVIEHNIAFVTAVADELYLLDAGVCIAHADMTSGDQLPDALNRYLNLLPAMETAEIEQLVEELIGESVATRYPGSVDGR
jgi:branched-chain amino acid transport system permease protein